MFDQFPVMSDAVYVVRTTHPKTAKRSLHHLALIGKCPLVGALEKELAIDHKTKNKQKAPFVSLFVFMSFRFSDLAHILGENSRLSEPDNGLSPITEESLSSTAR